MSRIRSSSARISENTPVVFFAWYEGRPLAFFTRGQSCSQWDVHKRILWSGNNFWLIWVFPDSIKCGKMNVKSYEMTLSISTFQNSDLFPIIHRPPMAICYCRGGEHGQMVGCDNDDCPYQWFHLDCLKLTAFPKSKTWYCPECQKRRIGKYSRVQRAD